MEVHIEWHYAVDLKSEWMGKEKLCLYIYQHPNYPEDDVIFYLGKAQTTTPYLRYVAEDKRKLETDLWKEKRIDYNNLSILVGIIHEDIFEPLIKKITKKALSYLESFLIDQMQPWGCIKSKKSRKINPDFEENLTVVCHWPNATESIYSSNYNPFNLD